ARCVAGTRTLRSLPRSDRSFITTAAAGPTCRVPTFASRTAVFGCKLMNRRWQNTTPNTRPIWRWHRKACPPVDRDGGSDKMHPEARSDSSDDGESAPWRTAMLGKSDRGRTAALLLGILLFAAGSSTQAEDWPQWLGAQRDAA